MSEDIWVFNSAQGKQRFVYRLKEDYSLPDGQVLRKGLIIEFVDDYPSRHLKKVLESVCTQNSINGTVWNEFPPIDILIWRNWIVSRTPFYTNERLD